MNRLLNKLEKRFGRYAVPDLIKYVIVLYCAGAAIGILNENIYYQYLSLDLSAVFHGQIWRLFTYLIEPYGFSSGMGFLVSILFFAIQVNLFFLFGRSLERAWGTFRFNMYFISGWFFNIVAALLLYLSPLHATRYESGFQYIYWSMFFAFAMENPDMEFLLYFLFPVKVKWLAVLDAVFMLYNVFANVVVAVQNVRAGMMAASEGVKSWYFSSAGQYFSVAMAILVAMANFLIYFFASRNYRRLTPGNIHRRKKFKKQMRQGARDASGARHRCAICGRTELDNDTLEFRYCSKCEGNYEYCADHLFTHEHIKK